MQLLPTSKVELCSARSVYDRYAKSESEDSTTRGLVRLLYRLEIGASLNTLGTRGEDDRNHNWIDLTNMIAGVTEHPAMHNDQKFERFCEYDPTGLTTMPHARRHRPLLQQREQKARLHIHTRLLALPIVMRTIQLCIRCCFKYELPGAANQGNEDLAVGTLLDNYIHHTLLSKEIDAFVKANPTLFSVWTCSPGVLFTSIECLEHILKWDTTKNTEPTTRSRHVLRVLGVHDSFERLDADGKIQLRMDTCVAYLLLECPLVAIRSHVADMIVNICAGRTETCTTYQFSIPVVHMECIFKMLASNLTTSSNAHTDVYFKLLLELINHAWRHNSMNVRLETEPIVTTYLLDEITRIAYVMTNHASSTILASPQQHNTSTPQVHPPFDTVDPHVYRLSLMCRVFTRKYSHHEIMSRPGSPFSSTPRESSPCLNF